MSQWNLTYHGWDPSQQPLREALCTLGNGYFATRGAAEEASAGGAHYPGTYLAGGFNRLPTEVHGRIVENEDLVNWPNWLCLKFRPADGEWFDLTHVEILDFHQDLDVRHGVLARRVRFRDDAGRESTLRSRRVVSMHDPHLAAIEWALTPENWSGRVVVRSALDGTVTNAGVQRYGDLNGNHLQALDEGTFEHEYIDLLVRTCQSHIVVAEAARTRVTQDDVPTNPSRRTVRHTGYVAQELQIDCRQGSTVRVEKVVALHSSRDRAIAEPRHEARQRVMRAGSFDDLLRDHQQAWAQLWNRCDMEIDDDDRDQLILRLHMFHLLQTVSMHTVGLDAGVPARGLHGEAYRGHIFWDELFIFPFLNMRVPEISRALMMYRYNRLNEARLAAADAGLRGAMFPWQSGSNGREESQTLHLNPKSQRWVPDNSRLQYHVNAAIAYNVWQHVQMTNDRQFLSRYGAEMLLEIARFWSSMATYNTDVDRYEIKRVMGPDEFHDRYPGAEQGGLDNNAYTNVMAVWTIRCALHTLEILSDSRRDEILRALSITETELDHWEDVSRRMRICFHDDGIISQFEGYENLQPFDWDGYKRKYENIQRLDRILEAENDSPNRYQVAKQADVLMLFYLFSTEELELLFERLGYEFDPQMIPRNVSYYMARTSHGSTLSRVVHSWVLARSDRQGSWNLFQKALESDVSDIQGGTTSEGIHLGAMAGTVDIVQRCYLGVEVRDGVLWFNPQLPAQLNRVHLFLHYRGHWLDVLATHDRLRIESPRGYEPGVAIGFDEQIWTLESGHAREIEIRPTTRR